MRKSSTASDSSEIGNPAAPRMSCGSMMQAPKRHESQQSTQPITPHQQIASTTRDHSRGVRLRHDPLATSVVTRIDESLQRASSWRPQGIYNHHPVTKLSDAQSRTCRSNRLPSCSSWSCRDLYNTAWRFHKHPEDHQDVLGNPLLDNTVVPYLPRSRSRARAQSMPLAIFRGKEPRLQEASSLPSRVDLMSIFC